MLNQKTKIVALLAGLVLLVAGLASAPVWARNPLPVNPSTGQPVDYYNDVFGPAIDAQDVNLQSTVYEIFLSLISSMQEALIQRQCDADCMQRLQKWQGADSGEGAYLAENPGYKYTGAIPALLSATGAFVTTPPVSSVTYIADVGSKLHLVQPAYAQAGAFGFGYEGLAPVRNIWTAFRNVAYLLATIGFVVLSFMIMFRLKISAQTVIGAQQAITKLIVVFLAVTFSYAIAGLIIDLLFVVSFVVITLFTSTGLLPGKPSAGQVQLELFSGNIIHQVAALWAVAGNASIVLEGMIDTLTARIDEVGWIVDKITDVFKWFSGGIAQLIITVLLIYALVKLLFQLLLTYLEIIILTILGPIMILPDILPGGNAFMGWMKRLFANAMVFPTVTFMFLLGRALVGEGATAANSLAQQGLRLPFLGLGAGPWVQPFLGLGIIFMTPKVVDMVKNALKVQSFPYTSAIGQTLAFGAGAVAPVAGAALRPRSSMAGIESTLGRLSGFRGGYERKMEGLQRQQALYQEALKNESSKPADIAKYRLSQSQKERLSRYKG